MSGPAVVCIKRKRGEEAPDALLLEQPGLKRQQNNIGGLQYVRQKDSASEGTGGARSGLVQANRMGNEGGMGSGLVQAGRLEGAFGGNGNVNARGQHAGTGASTHPTNGPSTSATNGGVAAAAVKPRRTFHLKRPEELELYANPNFKKQKRKYEGVATFVEQSAKRQRSFPDFSTQEMTLSKPYPNTQETTPSQPQSNTQKSTPSKPLPASEPRFKRPGLRAPANVNGSFPTNAHNAQADRAVANSLHEFAQQVAATEEKPRLTAVPKLPAQRSRELHRQNAVRNAANPVDQDGDADMDAEDEADYVYDTYILAPSSSDGAVQANAHDVIGNVGYLVITEEDQDVWETYLEDEPSDKDWNSDEEDENAEDWYGADYPDDELASDDEYGRANQRGFRTHGAADDEEWDEDTGNFSDEERDRQMNPWKQMSRQLA